MAELQRGALQGYIFRNRTNVANHNLPRSRLLLAPEDVLLLAQRPGQIFEFSTPTTILPQGSVSSVSTTWLLTEHDHDVGGGKGREETRKVIPQKVVLLALLADADARRGDHRRRRWEVRDNKSSADTQCKVGQ